MSENSLHEDDLIRNHHEDQEEQLPEQPEQPVEQPVIQRNIATSSTVLEMGKQNNQVALYDMELDKGKNFKEIIEFLQRSRIHTAISTPCTAFYSHQREFWKNARLDTSSTEAKLVSSIQGNEIVVSKTVIRRILGFNDENRSLLTFNRDRVHGCFKRCGYSGELAGKSELMKTLLPPQYRYLAHVLTHCLGGRKAGFDKLNEKTQSAFVALVLKAPYDFSGFVFHYFKANHFSLTQKYLIYARFLQLIINDAAPGLPKEDFDVIPLEAMTNVTFRRMEQTRNNEYKPDFSRKLVCHLAKPDYQCPPGNDWRNEDSDSNYEVSDDEEEEEGENQGNANESSRTEEDTNFIRRKRKGKEPMVFEPPQKKERRTKQKKDSPQQSTQRGSRQREQVQRQPSSFMQQARSATVVSQVSIREFKDVQSLLMTTVTRMNNIENRAFEEKKASDDRIETLEKDNKKLWKIVKSQKKKIKEMGKQLVVVVEEKHEKELKVLKDDVKKHLTSGKFMMITDGNDPEVSDLGGSGGDADEFADDETENEEATPLDNAITLRSEKRKGIVR